MNTQSLIRAAREQAALSQHELAVRALTSQSAIARLESGHSSPTIDTLGRVLGAAGFALRLSLDPLPPRDPVVEAYKRDIDRSLLRENLNRSVDERLQGLSDLVEFDTALRTAVRERSGTPKER